MAATDPLATRAQVISYLQTRPGMSIDPAIIDQLIPGASQELKTYCSDDFMRDIYTELRDGVGVEVRVPRYLTARRPVTAVSGVTVNGQTIPAAAPAPYKFGYVFDKTMLTFIGVCIPSWPAIVQFTYTAGYSTVPDDLNLVCVELVALKYIQRRRQGVSSEAVFGVGSRTYQWVKDLTQMSQQTLEQRKRVAPVGNIISP